MNKSEATKDTPGSAKGMHMKGFAGLVLVVPTTTQKIILLKPNMQNEPGKPSAAPIDMNTPNS